MDEPAIEAEGAKPLQTELERVAAVKDLLGLEEEIARFHARRVPAAFGFGATQDYKDSRSVIAQASQGGLGLPDRDYYTKDDDKSKATREEYVRHVARMFELLGDTPEASAASARTVMGIETRLAEISVTREGGQYKAEITANGYQTQVQIQALATAAGAKLQLRFERDGEEQMFKGRYKPGAMLLELERGGGQRLLTHWGAYAPATRERFRNPGVYFKRDR
jgi:predicted metalloendopeptidase